MNYMKQVAEMLGVELGEKFNIRYSGGETRPFDYYISENGNLICDNMECPSQDLFRSLLNGSSEIIKKPWKPKDCSRYTYVQTDGEVTFTVWADTAYDIALYAMGNCFRTEAEAEAHKPEILQKMKEVIGE